MRNIIKSFSSQNGIQFHYSLSTYKKGDQDSVLPESHDMCELFLLFNGKVEYLIEGKSYFPKSGDIILIHPGELHALRIDTSMPYERMVVQFSPNLLPKLNGLDLMLPFSNAKKTSHCIPAAIVERTTILSLLEKLQQLSSQRTPMIDFYIVQIIYQLITALLELPEYASYMDELARASATIDSLSQMCVKYVNEHVNENITANSIASTLNISPSHLQMVFKREMGVTLHKYIINQKMRAAQHMIKSGATPQEAADALGYPYYKTFYRNFLQVLGYPPSWHPSYHQKSSQTDRLKAENKQKTKR